MDNHAELCAEIIGFAGSAKNFFLEAVQILLNEDDLESAKSKSKEGFDLYTRAHAVHSNFLTKFANNEEIKVDILLVHAECHLAAAESIYSICSLLIEHFENKGVKS